MRANGCNALRQPPLCTNFACSNRACLSRSSPRSTDDDANTDTNTNTKPTPLSNRQAWDTTQGPKKCVPVRWAANNAGFTSGQKQAAHRGIGAAAGISWPTTRAVTHDQQLSMTSIDLGDVWVPRCPGAAGRALYYLASGRLHSTSASRDLLSTTTHNAVLGNWAASPPPLVQTDSVPQSPLLPSALLCSRPLSAFSTPAPTDASTLMQPNRPCRQRCC